MDEFAELSRPELLLALRDLLHINAEQQARIVHLEEEIARLRGGSPPPAGLREAPAFVKPNRKPTDPTQPKPARKPRPHGSGRRREAATRVVTHTPENCSGCGRKLSGGWLHSSRQVIELPDVPVQVIEHRFMACHCGVCNRREVAKPDLSEQVLGKCRVGVRLMSVIGYMDTVCRMPVATIQRHLLAQYRLKLSCGEIARILHTIARAGLGSYDDLLWQIRRSDVVHADETGAREDGFNGYVWSLSTTDVRYYHRDNSRAAAVIQKLLGFDPCVFAARSAKKVREAALAAQMLADAQRIKIERFTGKLVTDFYSAYLWYRGWHQVCLVHLDRDLDELKANNKEDPAVCAWVKKVLDLIWRAKQCANAHRQQPASTQQQRRADRGRFQEEGLELARPYCRSALPQRTLAERISKHVHQMFVFVEHLDVPPDNNAAERAIRPFVVQRKVSGGTRSNQGSKTQAVLMSLFETWTLRGLDPIQACIQMLTAKPKPAPT